MLLASVGARTPFFTSTFSNVARLASPAVVPRLTLGLGLGLGLGSALVLAAAGPASALVEDAEFSFPVLASLFPATTGTAVTATTKRLDNHVLSFNIKRYLLPVAHCSK